MLDICLLGTGGMMPLPYRWLTSMMARYNGTGILIDCGEGTQIALKEKGWSPKPIDIICFTHYHADHISGLPGMLLTMGNAERTEPLLLVGPKGLTKVVNSLRVIAPELPFAINCLELTEAEQTVAFNGFRIEAYKVNHNVLCYGYNIIVERIGRFDVNRALQLNIPKNYWNRLQKETVDVLMEHSMQAMEMCGMDRFAIAGGVASNSALRRALAEACEARKIAFYHPSPGLCTDNAAMIGAAAYYEYIKGVRHGYDLNAVPNLKLGEK